MTTKTHPRLETYLDDLGRMLAGTDPTLRAEVLGGVREHLEVRLGDHAPSDREVDAALLELGPPEAVAAAALDPDLPESRAHRHAAADERAVPLLARPGVATLALSLITAGLLLTTALTLRTFTAGPPEGGFFPPAPAYVLLSVSMFAVLPLLPLPLFPLGAVLVSASSLWRRSEKLAAWLLLPGLGVILALASHLSLVSDAGCRRDPPNCVGVAPAVGAVVYGGCLVLAGVAVFLVLLRLGRAGAARARALPGQDTAMSLSTSAEGAHRTHWWVPVLVLAGTGIGTLAAGAVPALLQGHTFPGSLDGVTGYLVWTGGRAQVLAGIAWVAPFWLAGTALLLRSALWGHWTKAAGALTAPILLAVALFATSGSVLTESRWHALPGIAATLGGIGLLITLMVTVRGLAVDAASPPAEQPASLG